MKKMIMAMVFALALLTVPCRVDAEILNAADYGYSVERYGVCEYDTATNTITITNPKAGAAFPAGWELNHFVIKGKLNELCIGGDETTKTIDVSEVDFSNCTEIYIFDCPNLETIEGLDYADLSTITEIHLGNTGISETAFPYKPGIEYSFLDAGSKKMPFKWAYRPEDKAALLAAKAIETRNRVKYESDPLVSNENPLWDAVEVTKDKFNLPEKIYASEYTSNNFDITKKVYLKSSYSFKYRIECGLEDTWDLNTNAVIGKQISVEIYSDGGKTSYDWTSFYIPYVDDTVKEPESAPDFPEDKEEDEEEETTKAEEEEVVKPKALKANATFKYGKNTYKVTKSSTTKGEVQVVKTKSTGTVTVPPTVKYKDVTYKVTSIGTGAFKNNTKITKAVIGKYVKSIGKQAFYGCKNLKTLTLGSSVQSIGTQAFQGCKKLTKVVLPKKVKTIGNKAFYGCSGLKTVTFGESVESIGESAFQGCTKISKITLPKKVKTIKKQAFYGCKGLKTVTIKSTSLKSVGSKAFKGCNSKLTVKVVKSKYSKYKTILKKAGVKTIKKF